MIEFQDLSITFLLLHDATSNLGDAEYCCREQACDSQEVVYEPTCKQNQPAFAQRIQGAKYVPLREQMTIYSHLICEVYRIVLFPPLFQQFMQPAVDCW